MLNRGININNMMIHKCKVCDIEVKPIKYTYLNSSRTSYYTPRVCSSKCRSTAFKNRDWSNQGAIMKKHRKALKKDKVKYNAFVEKVKANQKRIWQDRKIAGTFEAIHNKATETKNKWIATLTPLQRKKKFSRYYTCDNETINRLNKFGSEWFMKKWPNIDKKPYQSRYTPSNPAKYKGDVKNIICRSSWERKFANKCDRDKSIVEWGSEEIIIPYRSIDNRPHRYYPDFYLKVRQANGTFKKFVIEIKPKIQTKKPKKPQRITKTYRNALLTYERNKRKWSTAYAWCDKRDMKFIILTEDTLNTF